MLSLAAGLALVGSRPAMATGLESFPLPTLPESPSVVQEWQARNKGKKLPHYSQACFSNTLRIFPCIVATLNAAENSFQDSELLRTLKERSDANRDQRDKALREKYCFRQAELGVGDCAGLRLIPGATKSGVQKRPEWLDKLVFGDSPPSE